MLIVLQMMANFLRNNKNYYIHTIERQFCSAALSATLWEKKSGIAFCSVTLLLIVQQYTT
jgi:hypothetical protein